MYMEKKYIGIKDASSLLGVTNLTLRNWDRDGKLIAKRHPINNYRVYLKEDIDEILRKIESGEKPVKHARKGRIDENKEPVWRELKVVHLES